MRITIETTLLASAALTTAPHSALSLNGVQLVEEAQFFRAATAGFYARGNASVALQFRAQRLFSSIRAAEAFALLHASSIPLEGLLTCVAGESGDTQTVYLEDCVVENVQVVEYRGASVVVQYTIRGAAFSSDVPPEIPGETDEAEEFIVMRRGKVSIDAAAESVAVAFSSPLSAVPIVTPTISRPSGGAAIHCTTREDSVTVNGFTVDLSAATPDATYKLHYIAVE